MLSLNCEPILRRNILDHLLDHYRHEIERVPLAYAVYCQIAAPLDTLMRDILSSTLLYEQDDRIVGCLAVHDLVERSDTLWPGQGIISLQWAEQRNVVTSVWRRREQIQLPLELAWLQVLEEFAAVRDYEAADLAPPAFLSAPLNHTSTTRSASISQAMHTLLNTLKAQGYTATPGLDHTARYATYCLRKEGYPTVVMGFYREQINAF